MGFYLTSPSFFTTFESFFRLTLRLKLHFREKWGDCSFSFTKVKQKISHGMAGSVQREGEVLDRNICDGNSGIDIGTDDRLPSFIKYWKSRNVHSNRVFFQKAPSI